MGPLKCTYLSTPENHGREKVVDDIWYRVTTALGSYLCSLKHVTKVLILCIQEISKQNKKTHQQLKYAKYSCPQVGVGEL